MVELTIRPMPMTYHFQLRDDGGNLLSSSGNYYRTLGMIPLVDLRIALLTEVLMLILLVSLL